MEGVDGQRMKIPDWVPDLIADAAECATLSTADWEMLQMMRNRLAARKNRIGPKQYEHLRRIERKVYVSAPARRNA